MLSDTHWACRWFVVVNAQIDVVKLFGNVYDRFFLVIN